MVFFVCQASIPTVTEEDVQPPEPPKPQPKSVPVEIDEEAKEDVTKPDAAAATAPVPMGPAAAATVPAPPPKRPAWTQPGSGVMTARFGSFDENLLEELKQKGTDAAAPAGKAVPSDAAAIAAAGSAAEAAKAAADAAVAGTIFAGRGDRGGRMSRGRGARGGREGGRGSRGDAIANGEHPAPSAPGRGGGRGGRGDRVEPVSDMMEGGRGRGRGRAPGGRGRGGRATAAAADGEAEDIAITQASAADATTAAAAGQPTQAVPAPTGIAAGVKQAPGGTAVDGRGRRGGRQGRDISEGGGRGGRDSGRGGRGGRGGGRSTMQSPSSTAAAMLETLDIPATAFPMSAPPPPVGPKPATTTVHPLPSVQPPPPSAPQPIPGRVGTPASTASSAGATSGPVNPEAWNAKIAKDVAAMTLDDPLNEPVNLPASLDPTPPKDGIAQYERHMGIQSSSAAKDEDMNGVPPLPSDLIQSVDGTGGAAALIPSPNKTAAALSFPPPPAGMPGHPRPGLAPFSFPPLGPDGSASSAPGGAAGTLNMWGAQTPPLFGGMQQPNLVAAMESWMAAPGSVNPMFPGSSLNMSTGMSAAAPGSSGPPSQQLPNPLPLLPPFPFANPFAGPMGGLGTFGQFGGQPFIPTGKQPDWSTGLTPPLGIGSQGNPLAPPPLGGAAAVGQPGGLNLAGMHGAPGGFSPVPGAPAASEGGAVAQGFPGMPPNLLGGPGGPVASGPYPGHHQGHPAASQHMMQGGAAAAATTAAAPSGSAPLKLGGMQGGVSAPMPKHMMQQPMNPMQVQGGNKALATASGQVAAGAKLPDDIFGPLDTSRAGAAPAVPASAAIDSQQRGLGPKSQGPPAPPSGKRPGSSEQQMAYDQHGMGGRGGGRGGGPARGRNNSGRGGRGGSGPDRQDRQDRPASEPRSDRPGGHSQTSRQDVRQNLQREDGSNAGGPAGHASGMSNDPAAPPPMSNGPPQLGARSNGDGGRGRGGRGARGGGAGGPPQGTGRGRGPPPGPGKMMYVPKGQGAVEANRA